MRNSRGFNLLELMIAVAIISLIMLVVVPNVLDALDRGRRSSTQADMHTLAAALERYAADHHGYPVAASVDDLQPVVVPRYLKSLPSVDGWGHPLVYEVRDRGTGYSLSSPGKDGVFSAPSADQEFNADLVVIDGAFVKPQASDTAQESEDPDRAGA
ncbi:MAG: type II secretion system protein GspG [Acidobacteriota bacterium]